MITDRGLTKTRIGDYFANYGKITDFTVNGECSKCGQCCTNLLPIRKDELEEIHRFVRKKKIKPIPGEPDAIDMSCPFRNSEGCMIYRVRPEICRVFYCNKEPDKDTFQNPEKYRVVDMRHEFLGEPTVAERMVSALIASERRKQASGVLLR